MFLTSPTIEELEKFDLTTLLDMLSYQTELYFKLFSNEGISGSAHATKDFIYNLQAAIEQKKAAEKISPKNPNTTFIHDAHT